MCEDTENCSCGCDDTISITVGANGTNGLFGGFSQKFAFSSSTATSPTSTTIRLNNATMASVTEIYVNVTNSDSVNVAAFLDAFAAGGRYGVVKLFKEYDTTKYWMGEITAVTNMATYYKLIVTYYTHNSTFAAADPIVLTFSPNGAVGATGAAGSTPVVTIANTIFVAKNGVDGTALPERQDKPFLTIAAARTSALTYSRTQSARVLIKVATGTYQENIIVDNFIDYDLGDCLIQPLSGNPGIFCPNTTSYSTTTNNAPNCIIYGNAVIYSPNSNISGLENQGPSCKLVVYCNSIVADNHSAVVVRTGRTTIFANDIHTNNTSSVAISAIDVSTSSTYSSTPQLDVYNSKIYTYQGGSINQVINFYNGAFGVNLNSNYSTVSLINCQVGSWSTTQPAIGLTFAANQATARGYGQLSLIGTTIFSNAAISNARGSINDCYANDVSDRGSLKVYNYGGYANKAYSLTNSASAIKVGTVTISSDVQFNNGITI
jgi:hypothetical protein